MKSTNTFGIRSFLKTSHMLGLEAPIYVRITVDGVRVDLSLKQKINVTKWNPVQGKAKGTKDGAKGLNHFLRELEAKIVQIYQELQIKKNNFTVDAIKHELLETYSKDHTLSILFEFHHEQYRKKLAYGTLKKYFTTEKYAHNTIDCSHLFIQKLFQTGIQFFQFPLYLI